MTKALLAFFLMFSVSALLAQSSTTATIAATIEHAVGAEELTQQNSSYVMLSSEQPVSSLTAPAYLPYNGRLDLARFRIINSSLLYTISIFPDAGDRVPMKKAEASRPGKINVKPLPLPATSGAFVVEKVVDFNHFFNTYAADQGNLYVAVHFN